MRGRRVILVVAVGVVAVSAAVGGTVPMLFPEIGSPPVFPFPATVLGYAAYGGVSAAGLCSIGLLAVELASHAE